MRGQVVKERGVKERVGKEMCEERDVSEVREEAL